MSLETIDSTITTEAEIVGKFPRVGNPRALFTDAAKLLKADEKKLQTLSARDIREIEDGLSRPEGGVSRPSHAAVWIALLSEIEKEHPQLSFWRGDTAKYMKSANSGQFCLGDPEYSIAWSKEHRSNLLGRLSIARLRGLYSEGQIWMRQTGNIDSTIGWLIGTEDEGAPLAQFMEIFELVG